MSDIKLSNFASHSLLQFAAAKEGPWQMTAKKCEHNCASWPSIILLC